MKLQDQELLRLAADQANDLILLDRLFDRHGRLGLIGYVVQTSAKSSQFACRGGDQRGGSVTATI